MAKMAKKYGRLMTKKLDSKPHFYIKDKKSIYRKRRPYMGLHSCRLSGLLKKFEWIQQDQMCQKMW